MKLKNYKPLDTDKIMKQLHNGKVVSEKPVEPSLSQIPSVAHRRRQSTKAEYDGQHELQVCVFPQKADFT